MARVRSNVRTVRLVSYSLFSLFVERTHTNCWLRGRRFPNSLEAFQAEVDFTAAPNGTFGTFKCGTYVPVPTQPSGLRFCKRTNFSAD